MPLPSVRRRSFRRWITLAMATLTVAAAGIIVSAEPALAYSSRCSIDGAFWLPNYCDTDAVQANNTVCNCVAVETGVSLGCWANWKLIDIRNQAVVYQASTQASYTWINGLYSWYYLDVNMRGGCAGEFSLNNDG